MKHLTLESKKKGNDQELIQSHPASHPHAALKKAKPIGVDLFPAERVQASGETIIDDLTQICKSRKENPQKLTQLSSRSHPRHLVGKRTALKDITIDTTSDSQVNSNFPNRWSPASLTFNNYFYLFFIFIYNVNNHK